MHKALAIAALTSLTLAAPAFAANGAESGAISYDYLEGNYLNADVDGLGKNPDGFGISGSIGFTPMFHGFVDYNNLDYRGTTVQTTELGAGLNYSLSPMLDLVGRVGYIKAQIEGPGNDDGLGVQAGIRARVATDFEFDALAHYTDLDDGGDDTSLKLAGRWFFAPQFALGAGVEVSDDVKLWNVGFRWTF